MTVSTPSLAMTRIVRRPRLGYWVQRWVREPGTNTAWLCAEERVVLTTARGLRVTRSWPGPLTIEPSHVREISARRPPR
jgi:hypothetical protein